MQRWSVRLGFLWSLMLVVSACDLGPSPPPMRLTTVTWIGYAPFHIARALRFYPPPGLDIVTLNASVDTDHAFLQRRVDFAAGALFDALRLSDQGGDFKIILVLDSSSGADGIAARPGIASVRDLQGQRVAVEIGTLSQYTLLRALARVGLTEMDLSIVNMPHDEGLTVLQQHRVDAAVLWEPFLTRARTHGMATIFSSREIPGEIIDVLVVHSTVADRRRDDVVGILKAWHRAAQALRAQQPEAMQAALRYLGTTETALTSSLAGVDIPDLEGNRRLFDPANTHQSVWKVYALTAEFMVRHKLLQHPPREPAALFDGRFIARALAP